MFTLFDAQYQRLSFMRYTRVQGVSELSTFLPKDNR